MSNYNKKQEELMFKEFKVNEHSSIRRYDYESFPCAMLAFTWTDEQMQDLAEKIAAELSDYEDYDGDDEAYESDFWVTMENVAVENGMEYYEDFSDEKIEALNKNWKEIK